MAVYLLDGRLCPALFLDEFNPDGTARRAVYFYGSTEGKAGVEQRVSDSLVNASGYQLWTPENYPHGACFYLIVADDANLQAVLDNLTAAYAHREDCAAKASAAANAGNEGVAADEGGQPVEPADSNMPEWQQQGFASKAEWKKAQKG